MEKNAFSAWEPGGWGVAVPQVANLLELRAMLAETVLDWKK
jgi:hypothetical protein